jgi:hypothetical protein
MTTYAYYDILNRIQNLPKEEQLTELTLDELKKQS